MRQDGQGYTHAHTHTLPHTKIHVEQTPEVYILLHVVAYKQIKPAGENVHRIIHKQWKRGVDVAEEVGGVGGSAGGK